MLDGAKRQVAPIVVVGVALLVGAVGVAYGSPAPSTPHARASKGKGRNHTLSADYKSGRIGLDDASPPTYLFDDQAKLVGRPFRAKKAEVDELSQLTYNAPDCSPDCTGTEHTTFKATIFRRSGNGGGFRGYYDWSVDSNGQPSSPINGVITGGSGMFRGATGSFQVLDRVGYAIGDTTGYRAHWQGTIRY